MLLRLCQAKGFILATLLAFSCSLRKGEVSQHSPEMVSFFQSTWFSTHSEHALWNREGGAASHLFFDVHPEWSKSRDLVNVVITTPEGSPHYFEVDLVSGRKHYVHSFCSQDDVWKEGRGSYDRPPYSIGFIPRILDQLGHPQKILVFGGSQRIRRAVDAQYFRIRPIGAFIEKLCPSGNCVGSRLWPSRLVYIGVDPDDLEFQEVRDLESWRSRVDWESVKGAIENIHGRNHVGEYIFPAIKVGALLPLTEAFNFSVKNSVYLDDEEMKKIRSSCHYLYEKLWKELGENHQVWGERFKRLTASYFNEVVTCSKFVYAGNINHHVKKFWFLSQLGLYLRLHKEGYYFDCSKKAWSKNMYDVRGETFNQFQTGLRKCSTKDIDLAFTTLPSFLQGLRRTEHEFYRFIDYDNHGFGTHQKLYTWVKVPVKKFSCSSDVNEKIREGVSLFPTDVRWESHEEDIKPSREKVIY